MDTDDVEVAGKFLTGANTATEEVSEGQLNSPAVREAAEKLLAVFLAFAEGADVFPHRKLALAHLGGFNLAGCLAVGLGYVPFKYLTVGGPNYFGLLGATETGPHDEALLTFCG